MAYNRWLSSNYLEHHGVKGQQWGVTNGPPYPLDSSKSDGHKLIKGDGSPQGKKKYTSSQKTAHKRAVRKNRAEAASETERDIKRLNNFFNSHVGWDNIDAIDEDGSLNRRLEELYNGVDRGTITKESFVKEASGIRDEIRRRIDAEASNGSEWAPEVQKHLKDVDTYHRGVDEDKYEMTFLEAIQNEDWEVNNDKKRRDKEYAEYLKDREGYFQKGNAVKRERSGVTDIKSAKKKLRELGVDKSSIDEFDLWAQEIPEKDRVKWMQDEINEMLTEAHRPKDMDNLLKTKASGTPKKSIIDKISSFRDRVFGSKQEQTDVNGNKSIEPKSSEKAKTKRGETYEINDWGSGKDSIDTFKKNPEAHIKSARQAAISEARSILAQYAKTNPEAKRLLNMSNEQLGRRIGLNSVTGHSRATIEFSFGDLNGDFLKREVVVEYDLNKKRVINTSVQG